MFDSAFAKPSRFPRLFKKAKIVHPVIDYGLSPKAEDEEIYNFAVKINCFVVTINYKDFKKLVRPKKPGVIAIPAELSNEEIDILLTSFVSENDPDELLGKAIKI